MELVHARSICFISPLAEGLVGTEGASPSATVVGVALTGELVTPNSFTAFTLTLYVSLPSTLFISKGDAIVSCEK